MGSYKKHKILIINIITKMKFSKTAKNNFVRK